MPPHPEKMIMPLRKGAWSPDEDQKLIAYIKRYGIWNWSQMPKPAGLARSGKSCRLRWVNYLRPDIKRGKFSNEEEETVLKLHEMMGNRWSAIAAKLPGRTDNEIKNYWHTHLKKRFKNNSAPTTESTTVKESNVDAGLQNNSSDDQIHLLLRTTTEVSNLDNSKAILMSPQLLPTDDFSSSNTTTDPAVEIDRNIDQTMEKNFCSNGTFGEFESLWEHSFSLENLCAVENSGAIYPDPTTQGWLEEPTYYSYDDEAGNDFWVNLSMHAEMNGM